MGELEHFIELVRRRAAASAVPADTAAGHLADVMIPEDRIINQVPVVERILDRVTPDWRTTLSNDARDRWAQPKEAAQRAYTLLTREVEIRDRLGEGAPTIDADRLHRWAWQGASSMWASRHFRQSVVDALKRVNAETQNKTGRHDLSETDLFKQLFSTDPPKAGAPRLRLRHDDGSDTFRSMHRGAAALAEGLFAGIRNVVSHTVAETEIDEQLALEQLAAVSVLARWVDEASVSCVS
jgi:hypothetical protein